MTISHAQRRLLTCIDFFSTCIDDFIDARDICRAGREHLEDVPELTPYFIVKHAADACREVRDVSRKAITVLTNCYWPGNVRQLENVIRQAIVQYKDYKRAALSLGLPPKGMHRKLKNFGLDHLLGGDV
ncbi:MAG TPA: hypothetical protein VE422_34985 [Terriglobia bacterium]|nr:hypothetical protein [Terriglobia bacterium]